MPLTFFSEQDQQAILVAHNHAKPRTKTIPLVDRNAQTGWPLLQVSLFTPSVADTQRYEHALGGGKCHYFYIGAFNFASMIAKVPGKMTVTGNYEAPKDVNDLKIDNVAMFLEKFSVHHHVLGLKITSESGAYGKTLDVICPEGNPDKLRQGLDYSFSFAMRSGAKMTSIGAWKDSPSLSKEEIQDGINEEVAIFSGGQIFVDLGEFLEQKVKDPELKEYFKTIFKVDEFVALQQDNEEFKPSEPTSLLSVSERAISDELSELQAEKTFIRSPLSNLYSKVNLMRIYGESLSDKDTKISAAVVTLANKLSEELDAFNKQVLKAKPDKLDVEQFQSRFKTLLHSNDKIMGEHRDIWKPIVVNILFSLITLGFGLLGIGIKAGISVYRHYQYGDTLNLSKVLLFSQTGRETHIGSVEKEIDAIDDTLFSLPN